MFDIAIIGGGPGGYISAIRAAQLGANVCLIEKENLGGTCLNRGCIPTKSLAATAELFSKFERARKFGIFVERPELNYKMVNERNKKVITTLRQGINFLIRKNNIKLYNGNAELISEHIVRIKKDGITEEIESKNIILATGSIPSTPAFTKYDGEKVITSRELLSLEKLPESLIIVGGGVVGCEFASILNDLGVRVTVVEMLPSILSFADRDIIKQTTMNFKQRGIDLLTDTKFEDIKVNGEDVQVFISNGKVITGDKILISIGRKPYIAELGLENVGVITGKDGEIVVDKYLRTNFNNIYAVGDVTNISNLAHVASAQGIYVVEKIMGEKVESLDYNKIPKCIFTNPQIAYVGFSEEIAKEKGVEYKVGKFPFSAVGKALCDGETEGFVKIITDKEDKIIGMHIIGPHASDLLNEGTLALKLELNVNMIGSTVHSHPTLGEAVMEAAEAIGKKAIHILN